MAKTADKQIKKQATVITFINEKGGVGKTSTCFNLAWEMSARGKRILMIDMDGQQANLTFFVGAKKSDEMLTMYDVLVSGKDIHEPVLSIRENLDLIPANINVNGIGESVRLTRMKQKIAEIKEEYDYIFIDVNPSPDRRHFLSLSASDCCIILMLPDITSLEANRGVVDSIAEVQDTINPDLYILGILFNKNNTNTTLSKSVSEQANMMAEKLMTKVFRSKIRQAVVLSENVYQHVGITEYDPKSNAAADVNALVDEIMEEI